MAEQRARRILWVMLGIGAAALVAWLVVMPDADPGAVGDAGRAVDEAEAAEADTRAAPAAEAAERTAPSEMEPAAPQAPSGSAPADLFAGHMPDFMVPLHMRVLDDKRLNAGQVKQLMEYGREHPDDARPQLLLAWDAMHRDWGGAAARLYGLAFRADPRAKDDPSMLRDLLAVASTYDRAEFDAAAEILGEAYGAELIPTLDARIDELSAAGKSGGARRLHRLKDQLRSR